MFVDTVPGTKIWEKQDWETAREHSIFQKWLGMEHPRDLDRAAQLHFGAERTATNKLVTADSSIRRAYIGFPALEKHRTEPRPTWEERARAYDLHIQKKMLLDRQHRRERVKRNEFTTAMKLMEKAQEMLDWPLYAEEEKVDDEDNVYIIRQPAKWALRDVSSMARVASELARLATDMEQGHYKFTLSLTLSPDAIEALNFLEQFGVGTYDIVKEYEKAIIETAQEYARDKLGLAPAIVEGEVSNQNGADRDA